MHLPYQTQRKEGGISPSEVMSKDAIAQINQNLWRDIQAMPVIGGGN